MLRTLKDWRSGMHGADRLQNLLRPWGNGMESCGRVVLAVLLREARTRYGRRSAGYVWALISPMLLLLAMIATFSLLARPPGAGDSLVVFFLTAIIPVFFWRDVLERGSSAIRSNRNLMRYPQVNTFEIVTARALLEVVTYSQIGLLFVLVMFAFFHMPFSAWVDRPLSLMGAFLTLFLLGYGTCFLSSQVSRMFEPWGELTGLIGRFMLITSGLFFTLGSLPPAFLNVVKWNPLAHVVEWIRDAIIHDFSSTLYSPIYPLVVGVAFLSVGLFIDWLYRISGYDLDEA